MRRQQNGRKRIVSNTTPTSAPTGQNANQRVAPLLAAIDLRDYFAAQAINGLMAMIAAGKHDLSHLDGSTQEERLAVAGYRVADAMLAAR